MPVTLSNAKGLVFSGNMRPFAVLLRNDEVPHCIRDDKRRFLPSALV